MAYPTLEEPAERVAAALVATLRQTGAELERQVAAINAELETAQEQLAELGVRVDRLGVLVGDDDRRHSELVVGGHCEASDPTTARPCVRVAFHAGEHWYGGA
jgi:hypothetical protein